MEKANAAKVPLTSAASGNALPPEPVANLFVINLCASTTPVALTPPDHAGLKRFTFFVSRRREEGRERFRLHMGYFETQEEAERLLDIVREIYPGAWAGLSPGLRLRPKSQSWSSAAAATRATPATEPESALTALAVLEPEAQLPTLAPLPQLAPIGVPAAPAPAPAPELSDTDAAVRSLSEVRAAIASLDDTNVSPPTLSPLPEFRPGVELTLAASGAYKSLIGVTAEQPALPPAASHLMSEPASDLSDSATLRVLEGPTLESAAVAGTQELATPPDSVSPALASASTGARPRDEKTSFAVQLLWSVQPIDIAQIPQLAIFSAYTLYGAEGNREGRRWYGVRLGFFTDAVSAKQVAHYVRSDFSTVSVVPVTVRERERARLAATRPDATPIVAAKAAAAEQAAVPTYATSRPRPGFEFIEDKKPPVTPRPAPGKRAKSRAGRPGGGRSRAKSMTLEETLEILGADQLDVDDGRRPLINTPEPKENLPKPDKAKPSRFGRLLERLSERMG